MIIYNREKKQIVIPEGLGYDAQAQYEKGYYEGYKKGSDGQEIEIRMRYYDVGHCIMYLDNQHNNSMTMNGFDFYCNKWNDPWMQPFYENNYIKTVVNSTNVPDNLTFTFFCSTSARSEINPLPTKDDFDILTINEENYVIDDVTYKYDGTYHGGFEHWYCTFTCHKEVEEQNDNNEE